MNQLLLTELTSSKPFLDKLFLGTLQSLVERVDEHGFCQTSFGELNNVQCYSCCHYSRDAAEAAYVLADHGYFLKAQAILDFTLNNTPDDQYYIVHAYKQDGSILHNSIQLDTPAHPARALAKLLETGYQSEVLIGCFHKLNYFFDMAFEKHFHEKFSLLDSGNYNEQLGGDKEPVLDMFTNGAMYSGLLAMAKAAKLLGFESQKFITHANNIATGIEKHLYSPEQNLYLAAATLDGIIKKRALNWINLYPERWYSGNNSAWQNAYNYLWENSCNLWYHRQIPSGETNFMKLRTMGKVIAHFLSFGAKNHDLTHVDELLNFFEETVRKPDNIYPEWWYYNQAAAGESPYLEWFFDEYKGVWDSFKNNPNSDYTIDSGNCEQSSVFLDAYSQNILGIRGGFDNLEIAPVLPHFDYCEISKVIGIKNGKLIRLNVTVKADKLAVTASDSISNLTIKWQNQTLIFHNIMEVMV